MNAAFNLRLGAGIVLLVVCACSEPRGAPEIPKLLEAGSISDERWIGIDTQNQTLTVFERDIAKATFDNIALGVAGAGVKKRQGDGITPLGEFKVSSINRRSKFGIFIAINYPSKEYAERGYKTGILTKSAYREVLDAHNKGTLPPQNSRLGGHLGIHGVGGASLKIHRLINWTNGCVALDNDQMKQLLHWVTVGMKVKIM